MEFRYLALIALWTLISGPLVGVPSGPSPSSQQRPKVAKTAKAPAKPVARR
jgi:hypothetical protein